MAGTVLRIAIEYGPQVDHDIAGGLELIDALVRVRLQTVEALGDNLAPQLAAGWRTFCLHLTMGARGVLRDVVLEQQPDG